MIRCPTCGANEADGTEFEMILTTRVVYSGSTRTTPEGKLTYPSSWSEIGFDRRKGVILSCGECSHAWSTTREIDLDSA